MTTLIGTPKKALVAIGDMLDHCAKLQSGEEVLILAEIEGLYGGDSMVDQEAISWIQTAVQARGANASVLWIDEPAKVHKWRLPPIAKAAMSACDVLINHSFNIVSEEMVEFREHLAEHKFRMVRNFATTASLLCSAWAQTPYELVSEIRFQTSKYFKPGLSYELTDPNGTHLEGTILPPQSFAGIPGDLPYANRRGVGDYYFPWPEWMHPPVWLGNTNGIFIFESMLSWWSRYIGISPYFNKPIELVIKDARIIDIKGGDEAQALKRFMAAMVDRVGEAVYDFNALHFGIHPQAMVASHQCPNILIHRIIDHSHTCNIHVHVGNPSPTDAYPYWVHCTGDIRNPTWRVGDVMVYDQGRLITLDDPAVLAMAEKYPGRPGLAPEPRSF